MKKHPALQVAIVFAILAVVFYADPGFAQTFNNGNTGGNAQFETGLGGGVNRVLGTVVNAARIIGVAGGLIQMIRAGYEFQKGERDAMEALKGVIIGFVIIGAGMGIAQTLISTAATP
jgi:hypothetical protein